MFFFLPFNHSFLFEKDFHNSGGDCNNMWKPCQRLVAAEQEKTILDLCKQGGAAVVVAYSRCRRRRQRVYANF